MELRDPASLLNPFNEFARCVLLRVNEGRDQGEVNKYKLHDHMKTLLAAPPECLRVNEKHLRPYYIPNVVKVVVTTNHRYDSLYLPADDRRHYVQWSESTSADFTKEYFDAIWHEYDHGTGLADVAALLHSLDLSSFSPHAPPEKTTAFWDIVGAQSPVEEGEIADLLDLLGWPLAITVDMLRRACPWDRSDLRDWLGDRKNLKTVPHRLADCGYVQVVNSTEKKGLWAINGRRAMVYVRDVVQPSERAIVAGALCSSTLWLAKYRAKKAKNPKGKPEEWLP
jgi:hypothetical protein